MADKTFYQRSLKKFAENCADKILHANNSEYFKVPYKHIVIDNFLSDELAQNCLEAFPGLDDENWDFQNDKDIEVKYRSTWQSEFDIPDGMVETIRIFNSSLILNAMAKKMRIPKIVPDPYFTGGGLNMTMRNGLLDVHVDGNYHDATGLNRRLNLLLYLNPNWEPEWGGEFAIFDNEGRVCLKKIAPIFNRLVIFDSHDYSFHGVPDPINFPVGVGRKSILLYYYTKEPRPNNQVRISEPHSALWVKRGNLDKRGNETREYE
jgi:Rps23 Pro-64 3,4-dihydroxylase Tpa1-like proline 4-hydroxylase